MKLTKKHLQELIEKEVDRLNEWTGDEMESAQTDMTQKYIDFVVMVQEAARETLENIERGDEPAKAAHDSRFNTLVQGFTNEEFYDYFFG